MLCSPLIVALRLEDSAIYDLTVNFSDSTALTRAERRVYGGRDQHNARSTACPKILPVDSRNYNPKYISNNLKFRAKVSGGICSHENSTRGNLPNTRTFKVRATICRIESCLALVLTTSRRIRFLFELIDIYSRKLTFICVKHKYREIPYTSLVADITQSYHAYTKVITVVPAPNDFGAIIHPPLQCVFTHCLSWIWRSHPRYRGALFRGSR